MENQNTKGNTMNDSTEPTETDRIAELEEKYRDIETLSRTIESLVVMRTSIAEFNRNEPKVLFSAIIRCGEVSALAAKRYAKAVIS